MGVESQSENKRIAKNTVMLYFRMILTMVVGLYTSRVVLNALGFSDYGIYNVVGGVVSMMTFLNVGMSGASQRFISYEMGRGDGSGLKNVFCTSVITHMAIAAIVFVIMESVGLWFLNYKMVIPEDRMFAANWVFQCSILTFAISVISVPYNACIIAHEKMGTFAYISIYEVLVKLLVAYLIYVSPIDKLVLYSSLLCFVQFSIRIIYTIYCKRHFPECSFKYSFDKTLFKEMFAFAGWGCIGNMGFSLKDQGSNVILNLFFGTTVNAARGIATQVSSIINGFASNFTMAMNPQITKFYAAGDIVKSRELAFAGSRFAFYLLTLISIPFLINEHYVLRLWLGDVPEYTDIFVFIILLSSVIYSMSHTISTAILATGNIKWFQSLLALLLLLEIPIGYIILCLGGKPYQAILPSLATNFLSLILRIVIIHRLIPSYCIYDYCTRTVLRCLVIFVFCYVPSYYIKGILEENFVGLVLSVIISLVYCVFMIYAFGLSDIERASIIKVLRAKINKK